MKNIKLTTVKKHKRNFVSENLNFEKWENIKVFFDDLLNREINNKNDLLKWMKDRSELESVLDEELGWRYIKMNINTKDKDAKEKFDFFINKIVTKILPYKQKLNKKLIVNYKTFKNYLKDKKYEILLRNIKNEVKIFRKKNIPLLIEEKKKSQEYGAITGSMTINFNGKELTLQQGRKYLKSNNRKIREEVYLKINERQLKDAIKLNNLFSDLINIRNKIAQNADFDNYRDYMFVSLGRFDYTPEDCYNFHTAIQKEILPIINELNKERKEKLKLDKLRPWDLDVDITGKEPLKPFDTAKELIEKTKECFYRLDPFFAECIAIMEEMKHLDLESKVGKAPGGFNYPLDETGVPFIFMHSVGTHRDMVTMIHEGGHAVHSFLTRNLELNSFKHCPSEVAELASMGMELLTMDHWDVFFKEKEELKRAKKEQLEKIISILPWIAIIDKFQHWIYLNPKHTIEDRTKKWNEIFDAFSSNLIDWTNLEKYKNIIWQKQLHLFEVPFYYIEYGIAQLGAIALWRNYKKNPTETVKKYKEALKLGYTKSIAEIYEKAGIEFNFSQNYIKEIADFVKYELEKLK